MTLQFLLLEDNQLDAEVVQATLFEGGIDCELLHVETRSSFVAALETHEFDLILADYTLPDFDGIHALEIASNLRPDVPFIFVSGSLGEELVIETLKRGATDYVLKQRLGRLVPSVQRALREAKERRELKRAELMLFEHKQLLELIATGKPMDECLTFVCLSVSKLNPSVRACFQLTDDQRLKFLRSITPDFPSSFKQGFKDAPINELAIGTCGEAVYRAQPITCTDIANNERWSQGWRDLCVAHAVLACHSVPVLDVNNLPLGSLMLCFDEARLPTDWEYQLAEFGIQIASIVFERDRSILALRESEERFRTLADNMSQFAWMADASGWIFWYNHRWFEYTGTTLEEMQGWGWQQVHHPEHIERVVEHIRYCFETGEVWEDTFPLRGKDGTYRWFLSRAIPIHDEQGQVLRWFGTNTDITERKQTEELLTNNEERLRSFIEADVVGILFGDVHGNINDANDELLRIVGYTREDLRAGRLRWIDITPPEFLPLDEQYIAEAQARGACTPYEKEYIRSNGSRVPVLVGYSLFGETREESVAFILDLSEQKQAEEALRQSEARLKQLVELNLTGVMFWDVDGSVLDANDAFLNMVGYSREDLQAGRVNWRAMTPPEQLYRSEDSLNTMRQQQASEALEKEYIRKDGTRVPVLLGGVMFKNSQNRGVSFVVDISDRIQTERRLQESEARLKMAYKATRSGLWDWDLTCDIAYVSEEYCTMFGLDPAMRNVNYNLWLSCLHPDDRVLASESVNRTIEQQQEYYQAEYRLLHPDGIRWISARGQVFYDESGHAVRMLGNVQDISDRKQAELQLQQQTSKLRQLNVDLEQTTTKLTERNQELDRFVYTVSHDLKAPLRAISNLSQWIEDDLEGQLTPENQRQMELLRQRVARLEAMIDGLLAYSRIGRTEVATEKVNVDELLFEILDSLAPPPTFIISVQPEMPILFTKRLLLSQVFSNLISNAIKHHDRSDGQIEIRATQKGEYYEFSVVDNGRGIAPEDHERVFGLFQTLKGYEVKESTGIGLSIVKKIIETEGGKIFLDSQLGEGATFRFTWLIQSLGFHE